MSLVSSSSFLVVAVTAGCPYPASRLCPWPVVRVPSQLGRQRSSVSWAPSTEGKKNIQQVCSGRRKSKVRCPKKKRKR